MLIAIAATITVVLVAGSLLAIHTQSTGYRSTTPAGYVALADRVGMASTATGAQLSTLIAGAPTLTNSAFPNTARGILQQGLDAAVEDTGVQARQALNLESPPPEGNLAPQFTRALELRASATQALRTTIDDLLGMAPLPVAGGPATATNATPATLISVPQAAQEMAAEGRTFEQSDAVFRSVRAAVIRLRTSAHLRRSVWVPAPADTAPLSGASLGATATALASSQPLDPFHHLVITAVGLDPAAVPSGGAGTVSTSCVAPVSTVPGAAPAVVPPTSTLEALVSVTNCGNVPERGVTVSVTVAGADAPGPAPAPAGRRGGRVSAVVAIAPGASSAPDLGALPVASGHTYTLTVAVSLPPGQTDQRGTTQQFLVSITG